MTTTAWVFRENNLDLIRLFAALQVMVLHSFEYLMPDLAHGHWFFHLLRLFPGVPIFFFVSGFLISKSYERSPDQMSYTRNRVLRIYPALLLCVMGNILMVAATGYFQNSGASLADIAALFFAKTTFLQFYNPEFMRDFGDGVLNGSLWTVCVELQFYFVTPILYSVLKLKQHARTGVLLVLLVVLIGANRLLYFFAPEYSEHIVWKLYRVSFVPWFYMFIVGVLVQRHFDTISKWMMKIPSILFLLGYTAFAFVMSQQGWSFHNSISPIIYFPLVLLVLRLAYTQVALSHRLLKGNDISYGIYIWHMPLVNQMIYLQYDMTIFNIMALMVTIIVAAMLSWFLLEKNMLKLKRFTLLFSEKS